MPITSTAFINTTATYSTADSVTFSDMCVGGFGIGRSVSDSLTISTVAVEVHIAHPHPAEVVLLDRVVTATQTLDRSVTSAMVMDRAIAGVMSINRGVVTVRILDRDTTTVAIGDRV
jgi:hypothetical protein